METTPAKPDLGNRIGSMLLDHLFMSMAVGLLTGIFMLGSLVNAMPGLSPEHGTGVDFSFNFGFVMTGLLLGYAIYFSKDSLQGRSLGKRITKLRVVDQHSGNVASPWQALVRNLFILIWPIEVIFVLANPARRLGDLVAGTRVEPWDPEFQEPAPDWKKALFALGTVFAVLLLITWPARPYLNFSERFGDTLVESSEAPEPAKLIRATLDEELSGEATSDVKVWMEVEDRDYLFVSVILTPTAKGAVSSPVWDAKDALKSFLPEVFPDQSIKVRLQAKQYLSGLMEQETTFHIYPEEEWVEETQIDPDTDTED